MHKFRQIYCVEKTTLFEKFGKFKKQLEDKSALQTRLLNNHDKHRRFMEDFLKNADSKLS